MKRRDFLKLTAASATVTICFSGDVFASTTWTSGNISPDVSISARTARLFAKLVTERSKGEIKVEHFANSQLGNTQEQMENTAVGVQQVFTSSGSAASSLIKQFGIIDTAFLFRDRAHFERFMASRMAEDLKERLVSEFGVRMICSNWFALPRYLLHKDRFIEIPGDLEGQRIRSPNLPMFQANYDALGAVAVTVDYSEQYFALRQGLVSMTESAADRILPLKLHEVAPKITVCDMMYPQSGVYVNESSWSALTPELQEIVKTAADEAGEFHTRTAIEEFEEQKSKIVSEGGEFADMPEETRSALAEKIVNAEKKFVGEGLVSEGWFERIRAL